MKKIIVALCSLALSLAGTFGTNQLASNDQVIIDSNTKQVNIEQEADTTPEAEDNRIIDDEGTKEEKKVTKKSNDKKDDKKSSNKKANNTNVERKETKQGTNRNSNNKPITNNNDKNLAANSSRRKASDNINNFDNINSLQDILSSICDKETQGNNNKPAPTKPTPTKPAPTKPTPTKPAPTKPTPTKPTPTKPAPTKPTPTKPAPTTPPADNSSNNQGFAEEVLRLVNIERSKAGLSSLTTNATLKAAADKRAQETKTSFSHTRPNGSKFSTVLQEYGISYRTAGENIAYGQRSPQEVVNGWMNSPGHRANILNGSFGKIGIGIYQSGGVIYWAQLFTN